MRSVWSERRPGWPVVALAAVLGVAVGVGAPRAEPTAATLVDGESVTAAFEVRPCSGAWAAEVASLTPARHWAFGSDPAGDVASPGLLVCDPSGARRLAGGVEERVADPAGPLPEAAVATVAAWVSATDTTGGDLLWVTRADGYGVGLRYAAGRLQVVQAPAGGGPETVLGEVAAPDGDPHLIALTRSGGTSVRLWVDAVPVATVNLTVGGGGDLSVQLGARAGSGQAAARAVVDELLVLPAALGAGGMADLRAANTW